MRLVLPAPSMVSRSPGIRPLRFIVFSVDFNENFSNYLFRSTPFLPSKLKTRKERSWAELRLKNISIQWLSFTVVVIRFKRHSFFNIFLFRLSIEINEFCSKSCVDITGWTETRLHDSSVWKFIFDRISRVLLRCERVCVYSRVLFSYSFQKTKTCGSSIYVTRYRNK